MNEHRMWEIVRRFGFTGETESIAPYGRGHINETYCVTCSGGHHYLLQNVNVRVFKNPQEVMENIERVTEHLRRKIRERGGDESREAMRLLHTVDGLSYVEDSLGEVWRALTFIPNSKSYEIAQTERDCYLCGLAFGRFQSDLGDYPAGTLHVTIPDFHNTPVRLGAFLKAVEEDAAGRVRECREEIAFLKERFGCASYLTERAGKGLLPEKVTHNDTKLNNVLFDKETGQILTVVDLDTVMPGLTAYDFGDMIRSGAVTGLEDEKNLDNFDFDIVKYGGYLRGFTEGCGGTLTDEEIRVLPMAAYVITYEQSLRFLADYLNGDKYYRISYPEHNYVRTRTQVKLLKRMEEQMDRMQNMAEAFL